MGTDSLRISKPGSAWFVLLSILVLLAPLPGQDPKASADRATPFDGKFRESDQKGLEEAYVPPIYPSSHAANLLVLENGNLLCFWFSGAGEGHSNGIVMSRLIKGSQHWGAAVEVDHQDARSFQNPVAFQVAGGRIWLLHTSQIAGQWQTKAEVQYLTSDDGGEAWSKAKTLFSDPGSFVRQPPIVLDEARWLLPMYYTPSRSITDGAESNYSAVKSTNDGGAHWKECGIPKSDGLVQQSIVKLPNDHFVGFFRSRFADFIYQSTSSDGCVWTVPLPTALPNNNSSVQATLIRDGSIVIAFNNSSAGTTRDRPATAARKPLSIALSKDGGKSWPWIRDVEPGIPHLEEDASKSSKAEEYSYPSIVQDKTGQIYVAYTYRHKTIKVVKFREDWIKHGSSSGSFQGNQKRQPDRTAYE